MILSAAEWSTLSHAEFESANLPGTVGGFRRTRVALGLGGGDRYKQHQQGDREGACASAD
jgi:hypothetical protein